MQFAAAVDAAADPSRPKRQAEHVRALLPLALVLILAAATRLPFPDLTPFGHDEALEAARARPIWYGARPVDSEITSWWIPDPAGLLYLFALAEAFPRPAIARVEMVALANVAAVLLTYALAQRFFGAAAALCAGLLYAVNPWAAMFGRQPWVITQPLLTTVMLFSAMQVVVRGDRRWAPVFCIALAAQSQTHLLAVLYGLPALLSIALFWRRWSGRELLVGLVAGALLVAPYALHLWGIRDEIVEALSRGNRGLTVAPDSTAVTLAVWLISGALLEAKLGFTTHYLALLKGPMLGSTVLSTCLLVAGVVGSSLCCVRRRAGWEAHALSLIWFVGPLAVMTWQSSAVFIHYLLILLPTPFLLMGVGMQILLGVAHSALARAAAISVFGALCVFQLGALGAFYSALEESLSAPRSDLSPSELQSRFNEIELSAKQAGIGELHGLPLRYWQGVADRAKDLASRAQTDDVVLFTGIQDDGARHLDRRRKALDYLLGPELSARFPLEGMTLAPTSNDTLFLTVPEHDLPRVAGRSASRLAEIPLPGTNGSTRLWLVRARAADELVAPRARSDARYANGVRLVGLDAPTTVERGQSFPVATYWLVERERSPEDEDDEPFVELQAANGSALTRRGATGLPSDQWRRGDLLIQRTTLTAPIDAPVGELRVAVGLAGRRDGARAAIISGQNAGEDAAVLTGIMVSGGS